MSDLDTIIPEPDYEGFIEWVENEYTDNRWSSVYRRDESVTVWSGKYPAFPRFIKDVRPRLHQHGLVVWDVRTNVPKSINGEMEKVMWVKAVPVALAIAPALDMQCKRTVCRAIIEDAESDYCPECKPFFE